MAEPFSQYQGWLSKSWLQGHDEYIDVLPSNITLSRRYCDGYLKIEIISLSPKYQIFFKTVSSAPDNCLPYYTTDPLLHKIDEIAIHTLRNCMQDFFEDGPKRERRLWLGDLRLQALVNNITFKQYDLVRRCLYLFACHRREDGMLSANIFVNLISLRMIHFCLIMPCFMSISSMTISWQPMMKKQQWNFGLLH